MHHGLAFTACLVCCGGSVTKTGDAGSDAASFPAQAIVAANVTPATMGANVGMACNSPREFLWIPQAADGPDGPDTTNNLNIVVDGTDGFSISCSVVPAGTNYAVTLTAQATGSSPATLTISGTFTPRGRDGSGTPNADSAPIPNITMDFLDPVKHLQQTNCFAQYVSAAAGQPGIALPTVADTYADANGGRIWASVFCQDPQNLVEAQKPGNSGCATTTTFRFENCTSR